MSSVVVSPADRAVFIANGKAPVVLNQFIEFPLPGDFDPNYFEQQSFRSIDNSWLRINYPNIVEAQQYYIMAKRAYEEENDVYIALERVRQAIEKDPDNLNYKFVYAILMLKNEKYIPHRTRFKGALKIFDEILASNSKNTQLRIVCHYMRGLIYAHWSGEIYRKKAYQELEIVAKYPGADQKIKDGVERVVRLLRYSEAGDFGGRYLLNPSEISLVMQYADLLNY